MTSDWSFQYDYRHASQSKESIPFELYFMPPHYKFDLALLKEMNVVDYHLNKW